MARPLRTIAVPPPQVEAMPDPRPDLRRLAESTSLGSYVLRWQLVQPAAPRNAAVV